MQQISKVRGNAAHNLRASGGTTAQSLQLLEKRHSMLFSVQRSCSWGNAHDSCIADFYSSLPTVTWKKSAGVLQEQDRPDV